MLSKTHIGLEECQTRSEFVRFLGTTNETLESVLLKDIIEAAARFGVELERWADAIVTPDGSKGIGVGVLKRWRQGTVPSDAMRESTLTALRSIL